MNTKDVRWIAHSPKSTRVLRIGRAGDRFVAEWAGIGTLYATTGGGFEFVPAPNASPTAIAKLQSGLTHAFLRHIEGHITLHASAAQVGGVAIACLGESGLGKSTQIAALVRAPQTALLADDTLALEFDDSGRVLVSATEPVSWLLPDARDALGLCSAIRHKEPIHPPRHGSGALPLALLAVLAFDDALPGPRLRRLRGRELLERLLPSVIRFVLDETERHKHELDQLSVLAERVPIYELARPRSLALLENANTLLVTAATSESAEEASRAH